jgi:alkylhydroperoxidase family enzyme
VTTSDVTAADGSPSGVCVLPHPRIAPAVEGTIPLFATFGHAPGLIEGWMAWYQPLMVGGRVPVRTKELCRLAVAARTGCHMCQNGRFPDPAQGGAPAVPEPDAEAVLTGRFDGFTDAERAALAWTVAYWDDHRTISDAVIADACEALGTDGFLEVAVMVAQFTGMGRMFAALGLTAE